MKEVIQALNNYACSNLSPLYLAVGGYFIGSFLADVILLADALIHFLRQDHE